ncbi:hypothetical protein GOBAR_DD26824 [Gossypium barbadense]|nr:hypothetical protein GOBAR_DD26824 [Gossypium barbadense]
MCGFDINLNVGCSDQYNGGAKSTWVENPHHVALQIHPVIVETDGHGEDGSDNNGRYDHEDDENDYAPLVGNSSYGIAIHHDPRAYMSIVDLNAIHASEFPKYLNIIPAHLMLADSKSEELFMGQRFTSKYVRVVHQVV